MILVENYQFMIQKLSMLKAMEYQSISVATFIHANTVFDINDKDEGEDVVSASVLEIE